MNVLVAIDSFKGSLSSYEAGCAIADGVHLADESAFVDIVPIADGGEGTVEALVAGLGGRLRDVEVTGPHGRKITCTYGLSSDGKTAVIEMSAAAGITLVSGKEKNPLYTTTYGVGEMIKDALLIGVRDFVIGIGGSATNDGGVGMLSALGFEFLNEEGAPVPFGAVGVRDIRKIKIEGALPSLTDCRFRIACDVKNPLCGNLGCSAVFAPQKGADAQSVIDMDGWLASYAALTQKVLPNADPMAEGAGAAGGLGFAFTAFLNAELTNGIRLILEYIRLHERVQKADIVVTGEGRLDAQTVMGKAPIGVAEAAKACGKPIVAFSGCIGDGATACNAHGIDAFFPILRSVVGLEEAMNKDTAYRNLRDTAEQVFRLIACVGSR